MSLVEYAKSELELAGLFDEDSDYDGMIGSAALEIVEVFAKQGHSGGSAFLVTNIVNQLMQFKPLTPLTYNPDEWNHVGSNTWQNRRRSSVFSKDGGLTHYDIDEESNA